VRKIEQPEHGTYAGWNWHMKRSVPLCQPCRDANANYKREYRKDPVKRQKQRDHVVAEGRAQRRLARLYPGRYRTLLNEERAKLGLRALP